MKTLRSLSSRSKHHTVRALICANLVFIVALGLVGVLRSPVARGQAQQAAAQISGVFDLDLADVKPSPALTSAVKNAHRPCYPPRATFTVMTSGAGDVAFVTSLATARVAAMTSFLSSEGLDPSQFKVESRIANVETVLVNYDKFNSDKDTDAPSLKVTPTPPEGTKVKPGDKIIITMTASERYEDGHKSWPTGVQFIQLTTADDVLVDRKDYGSPPQPCEVRTFEAIYTVPKDPPPMVRLRAIAEDGVRNDYIIDSYFPTTDQFTIQGSYEQVSDVIIKDQTSTQHVTIHHTASFTAKSREGNSIKGSGHINFIQNWELHDSKTPDCGFSWSSGNISWDVVMIGTFQKNADGSISVNLQPTPSMSPLGNPLPAACNSRTTPFYAGAFPVGGTLVNGRYEGRQNLPTGDGQGVNWWATHMVIVPNK